MTYIEKIRHIELAKLTVDQANQLITILVSELSAQADSQNLTELDVLVHQVDDLYQTIQLRAETTPTDLEWQITERRIKELGVMFEIGKRRTELLHHLTTQVLSSRSQVIGNLDQAGWDTSALAEPDLQ